MGVKERVLEEGAGSRDQAGEVDAGKEARRTRERPAVHLRSF
jgi:hypothetical protein